MHIREIIQEAVGGNFLYHHAKPEHFQGILRDGKIKTPAEDSEDDSGEYCTPGTICMTRSQQFGAYDRPIMIVLKKDALQQSHRVEPATYYLGPPEAQSNQPGAYTRIPKKGAYGPTSARGEQEERAYKDIPFTGRYVDRVVTSMRFSPRIMQRLEQLGIPVEQVSKKI